MNKFEFKNLTPFKWFVLENFPFIEADFDALTEWQLFCKLGKEMNKIINSENTLGTQMENVTNAFIDLQNYVNNYFDNLDVQEEINNKLNALVEDGTLENLIGAYIQPRIDEQNEEIANFKLNVNNRLQNQDLTIAGLESGSPIFVSSTSDMTDNTKVYVLTTNMHIYYYNGGAFVDSTIQYSAGTSIMSGYNTLLNTATQWKNFNNDFNNLIPNKIYFCSQPTSVVLTNAPYSTFNGVVMCINHREQTNGVVQYAHNPSRGLYVRQCWGTTWYDWKKITTSTDLEQFTNALRGYGSIINSVNAWSQFDNDFDKLINNRIYTVQNTTGVTQLHSPTGQNVSGTLLSYNNYSGNRDGQTQLFIPYNANNIYIRLKWGGSWSEWKNVISDSYINPLLNNRFDELYKVFDTVGVIGDSLASGECAYKDNGNTRYIDLYDKSWGQFMARDSGNTYYNFSKGGLTTRSWFTTEQGYPTASDGNHKCKAYIIGLGVNDQTLGSDYVGTSADINLNDYTQNADTFYGNYAKIIQTMKLQQPKAKFFLFTVPNSSTNYDNINTAIRYMATIFDNVYVIDLRTNYINFYQGDVFIRNNLRSGHYNAIAYEYMAKMIEQWISQYIYDNYEEFEQVEFIGTDYVWIE